MFTVHVVNKKLNRFFEQDENVIDVSFRVCSLDVRSRNKGTKSLAHLYEPELRAEK